MKVLMVGCGAVGQVFGHYLQKSGVTLAFYARPASAERLEAGLAHGGLPLFQVSHAHRKDPIPHRLGGYQVVTDLAQAQQFAPHQVWFTTPSPVYYTSWFREFLQEVPAERVVCFAPEGGRSEFIPPGEMPDRMVFGGITLIAWQGDLTGGGERAGAVHFWLPPLAQVPLVGSEAACRPVAALMKKAGLRAAIKKDSFRPMQAATTALLSGFTGGLELAGWSLSAYRRSPWLQRGARAAREAAAGQLAGASPFTRALLMPLFSTPVFYAAAALLPHLAPFDLEKYLQFHYRKTRAQTLTLLAVFIRDAEAAGLAVENLRALLQGLQGSTAAPFK